MMYVIFNRLASGLNLYYLTFNLATVVQQKWIQKHLEKQGLSMGGPAPKGSGKKAPAPSPNGQKKKKRKSSSSRRKR